MKPLTFCSYFLVVALAGALAGCATTSTKAAAVTDNIRDSLDKAGYTDVKVSQDRDKGVVTLSGKVATDGDKAQAETIAKSFSGSQVVSNEIAVLPLGNERDAKTVNSELDEGIENNLKAALIQNRLNDGVDYSVKNHVVTLTGHVDSQAKRTQVAQIATAVVNVKQVVNNLQVKNQKATTSK